MYPSALQAPPDKYSAKLHAVDVCWRVVNSDRIVIGPEPKVVLAVRARRDVELLLAKVDYPELGKLPGAAVHAAILKVPHTVGLRRLKPEGEPWVWGQENVPAEAMFGGDPADAATAPEQVRWYGHTVKLAEYNVCFSPNDYWACRTRLAVPKGYTLGIVAWAEGVPAETTICRAKLAGV